MIGDCVDRRSTSEEDGRIDESLPIGISIIIVSIGRDELVRTIETARKAAAASGLSHEIVLVDDSSDGAVGALLADAGVDDRDIVSVTTGSHNIATARNAGLDRARGRFLAFIDDDEWAEPDWLVSHLDAIERFSADATIGPVRAHYPSDAPAFIRSGDPYSRWFLPPGQILPRGTTANALIRRSKLEDAGLRFDESFGRSGGEDSDLFRRFVENGNRVVAGGGLVHETIPLNRCNIRDLSRRALRVGQTFARSEQEGASVPKRTKAFLVALAKTGANASAGLALLPFGMKRAMPKAQAAMRNCGKMREALGLDLIDYYRKS